jgi:hypothetical protein
VNSSSFWRDVVISSADHAGTIPARYHCNDRSTSPRCYRAILEFGAHSFSVFLSNLASAVRLCACSQDANSDSSAAPTNSAEQRIHIPRHTSSGALQDIFTEHYTSDLLPLREVQSALIALWTAVPISCPDPTQTEKKGEMRAHVAVRWLCLLPSNPQPKDAALVHQLKQQLVNFVSAPWNSVLEAEKNGPAAAADAASQQSEALQIAWRAANNAFAYLLGIPLIDEPTATPAAASSSFSFQAPVVAPPVRHRPVSIHAADFFRKLPLHLTKEAPQNVSGILQHLKPFLFSQHASQQSQQYLFGTEATIVTALLSMIDWGLDDRISAWVAAVIDGARIAKRFEMLRHLSVAHAARKIAPQLKEVEKRQGAFEVLRKLLLGDQTQQTAFVSCITVLVEATKKMTEEVEQMRQPDRASAATVSLRFLRSYFLLLRSLIYNFTGNLAYAPLVDALNLLASAALRSPSPFGTPDQKQLEIEPKEREMMEEMKRGNWGALSTFPASTAMEMRSRSGTEKTGLDNLGNTCYMNSVLQSLFMTDSLRLQLLRIERSRHYAFMKSHPILTHLQTLFGFLLFTHRSSYDASVFHRTLPDMFRDASQQDAGEFAKYVLDAIGSGMSKYKTLKSGTVQPLSPGTAISVPQAAPVNADVPKPTATPLNSATPVADGGVKGGSPDVAMQDACVPASSGISVPTAVAASPPHRPNLVLSNYLRTNSLVASF